MIDEYDFEMVKRAYAEMARRAREKNPMRRPRRDAVNDGRPPEVSPVDISQTAAETR